MFSPFVDLITNTTIVWYLALNLISITIFSLGIYFKRYYDREAVITCVLFNLFVFAVVTAFLNVSSEMSAGFGFGLFAILSLITLRSETLTRTTITFFFGSLSIALINALGLDNGALVVFLNATILLAAWIVDHPDLLSGVQNMKLVLDHIPEGILEHSPAALKDLSDVLHVQVITYTVVNIDQVKDTVKLEVAYRRA
jgi:Domain of unknown function (DUF4956)